MRSDEHNWPLFIQLINRFVFDSLSTLCGFIKSQNISDYRGVAYRTRCSPNYSIDPWYLTLVDKCKTVLSAWFDCSLLVGNIMDICILWWLYMVLNSLKTSIKHNKNVLTNIAEIYCLVYVYTCTQEPVSAIVSLGLTVWYRHTVRIQFITVIVIC